MSFSMKRWSCLSLPFILFLLALAVDRGEPAYAAKPDAPTRPSNLLLTVSSNDPTNLFIADDLNPSHPVTLSIEAMNRTSKSGSVRYAWKLTDYWGKTVRAGKSKSTAVAPNGTDKLFLSFHREADLKDRTGIYAFEITATLGREKAQVQTAFGVVPRPAAGMREKSLFGVSMGAGVDGETLSALQKIGARWLRTPSGTSWAEVEGGGKGTYNWDRFDRLSSEARAHSLMLLPVLGKTPDWAKPRFEDGRPNTGMELPVTVRNHADYVAAAVARYAREVKYWELWDQPTVMGTTWQGAAAPFRELMKGDYAAAKRANSSAIVLSSSGNVGHLQDVAFAPGAEATQALDETSAHAYARGAPEEDFFSQAELTALLSKKYQKPQVWLTGHFTAPPEGESIAPYVPRAYVLAILAGVTHLNWSSGVNAETGLFGPGGAPTSAAVAYAVAAHQLDNTLFIRDLWPHSRRIFGAVFKNPAGVKIAPIWAVGDKGSLSIDDAKAVHAYDLMGGEVGRRVGDRLDVPFGEEVVYLTSEEDQAAFIDKVKNARIVGITPVEVVAKPFLSPVALTPPIRVKVTNMLNRPIDGILDVSTPKGWKLAEKQDPFGPLEPGQSVLVELPVRQTAVSTENTYPVEVTAKSKHSGISSFFVRITGPEWRVRRQQTLFLAGATQGRPTIDGDLSDWTDALPLQMNSKEYISPWAPKEWRDAWTPGNLTAHFYTMYDESNFYVAAKVTDNFQHGFSNAKNPYDFPYKGDSIQIAFSPVQGTEITWLKSPTAPDMARGILNDTDYELSLALTPRGPEAFRLHTPQSGYTTPYPMNLTAGLGLTDAVKLVVRRDDVSETTTYEAAIPWAELSGLQRNGPFHLAFKVNDLDRDGDPFGWMDSSTGAGELRGGLLTFSPAGQYNTANLSDWVLLPK